MSAGLILMCDFIMRQHCALNGIGRFTDK